MDNYALCSENISELAAAMLKVQAALQPVSRDQENPEYGSRFATLNAVMACCKQALLANGIWLTQYPVASEAGSLTLITKITHADSGQWQTSCLHMPLPKADPQGYGSAMTYARRYGLSALLGIVCGPDDDGNAASLNSNAKVVEKPSATTSQQSTRAAAKPETSPAAAQDATAAMPKLDGVEYSTSQQSGRLRIVASGKTYNKKRMLAQSGFQWDDQQKVWWRFADAA